MRITRINTTNTRIIMYLRLLVRRFIPRLDLIMVRMRGILRLSMRDIWRSVRRDCRARMARLGGRRIRLIRRICVERGFRGGRGVY